MILLYLFVLLGLMIYLNCTSVRWVMRIQGIFTAAKLVALVAIIVAGLVHIGQGNLFIIVLVLFPSTGNNFSPKVILKMVIVVVIFSKTTELYP